MENLYNLGMLEIEHQVATRVKDNNYPAFYDPTLHLFNFQFENSYGSELLYNMFPENGEGIFKSMTIAEWGDFMNKVGIWETKDGDQRTKERAKVEAFAAKMYEKYKDSEGATPYVRVDKRAERAKAAKASDEEVLENLYQSDESVADEKKSDNYTTKEKENAQSKWEAMSRLPRIGIEGDLLYSIATNGKVDDAVLSQYATIVGRAQALAFVESLKDSNLIIPIGGTEAIIKYSLMQQLYKGNNVEGSLKIDAKGLFAITDENTVKIDALEKQVTDVSAIIDSKTASHIDKENARQELVELRTQIQAIKKNQNIARNLPTVPSVVGTSSNEANILSYAALLATGDYNGLPQEIIAQIDVAGAEGKIDLETFKGYLAKFEYTTAEVNKIIQQQAALSYDIKALISSFATDAAMDSATRSKIESLIAKNKQLETKKRQARKLQVPAAIAIVAAQQGGLEVDGLTGPIAEVQTTEITSDKITNDTVSKRLKTLDKEIKALDKKINEAKTTREKLILMDEQSIKKFEAVAAKNLIELNRAEFDLTSEIGDVGLSLTEKQKKTLTAREEQAEKVYKQVFDIIRKGKLNLREDQDAAILLDISADQIASAIAYGLKRVGEESYPTANDLISDIAALLDFPQGDLTTREVRVKKARAADYVVTMLENKGILTLEPGLKKKDPHTVGIIEDQFITDFIYADTKQNLPSAETINKIKVDARSWTELQFERPADWDSPEHASGLALDSKRQEGDEMSKKEYPKVYKILNKAKDTKLSVRTGPLNIAKQMLLLDHPAFTFTNKNYTREQRSGKLRELEAILAKAESAGDRDFYSLFKYGSRGRLYASTSYLNHQAAKLANSLIQLGNPEAMGVQGYAMLLADIGENSGAQANTLEELSKATVDNMSTWMKWIANPRKYADQIYGDKNGQGGMAEPHLWVSGMSELRDAMKHGDPSTYPSSYVNYVDASVSGVQVLGSTLRDESSLKWVNLTPGVDKADLYVEIFNKVAAAKMVLNPTEQQLLDFKAIGDELAEYEQRIKDTKERDYAEFRELQEQAKKEGVELSEEDVQTFWESKRSFVLPGDKNTIIDEETGKKSKEETVVRVSESTYVKHLKNQFVKSVDMDTYNRVFWGQQMWLEQGRSAGKKPVMTSTYAATIGSMADGLFKQFSVERDSEGNPVQISPENTQWIAKELDAELQNTLPRITSFKNYLQNLALELAAAGLDFGYKGPVTGFNYKRRYREADTIRINHKARGKEDVRLSHAVGDVEGITDGAISNIKNGVVANFTHAGDKEIVGDLYLNFKKDLLTIHDAFGSKLADSFEMMRQVRESHKKIFDMNVLEQVLIENIVDTGLGDMNRVKADLAMLMANTWDSNDVFHNQHNYGKSGKPNKEKNVQNIFDRAGVDKESRTDKTVSEPSSSQPNSTVTYKDGNIVTTASPEYTENLKKKVSEPIMNKVAGNLSTEVNRHLTTLTALSQKIVKTNGEETHAINEVMALTSAAEKVNAALEGDISTLEAAIEEFEKSSDEYKKAVRGAENKLHNATINNMKKQYLIYYLNKVNKEDVKVTGVQVKTYQQSVADLIVKSEPAVDPVAGIQPEAKPTVENVESVDNRTCKL